MTVRFVKCAFALLIPCLASSALAEDPWELDTDLEVTQDDAVGNGLLRDLPDLELKVYMQLRNSFGSGAEDDDAVADVMWGSTAEYQGVFLWPDTDSYSQQFEMLDSGGGYFRLRARHSQQCLMLDWRNRYGNGTPVIQYPHCDAGYAGSEWRMSIVHSPSDTPGFYPGTPVLINRATGQCLDAANPAGHAAPMQSVLQQWDCITSGDDWNAGNQTWSLRPAH